MPASNPAPSPEPPAVPLLPPILAGPAAFLWLWALPVAVLLALNVQSHALIGGNLDPAQTSIAMWLGLANVANLLGALALAALGFRWQRQGRPERLRHARWSWLIVAAQAGYLWAATVNAQDLLPRSVTAWIFPESRYFFNQYAFTMLPLFFGILRLAGLNTTGGARAITAGLLMALVPPGLLYLAGTVLFRDWFNHPGDVAEVVFGVLFVVMGVLMFTGVIRLTLLILRLVRRSRTRGELVMVAIIALALPLSGLALNRDIPFPVDFQASEVYALSVLNALLLGASCLLRERSPRVCLGLLCATLPYSLYFFLVFLPFTPLSILAIMALGAGFLVLTPTFLLTLHLHLLNQARCALPTHTRRGAVWMLCVGSFLVLPAAFTGRALADRAALNGALDYVYSPVIDAGELRYAHSLGNLRRAIDNHRDYKDGLYYPFLSEAYAWLVFDNLVLSDPKLDRIETTFFGAATASREHRTDRWDFFDGRGSNRDRNLMPRAQPPPRLVEVTDLGWSAANGQSNATVTLRLTLEAPAETPQSEYITRLPLPEGVFVNGFRLHVNGQPVPGRITEKKTALWVYTMIRDSERRDPGLLFYDDDELELRVFPVVGGTPSVVEIDFLTPGHVANASLGTAPATPAEAVAGLAGLDDEAMAPAVITGDSTVLAVPPRGLPVSTARRPYLHLIVDRSAANAYPADWREALPTLRRAFPRAALARVTLAHHDTLDVVPTLTALDALPGPDANDLAPSGALGLDAVLARAIRQHRDLDLDAGADAPEPPP
ncbi:MAG: MSEP-CTERM sorting domain-containing protein, partial [Verrucomicrobiota bacterium]